jgi:hypothetical protein
LVKEILTQYELTVDSTEQPIERPGTYEELQYCPTNRDTLNTPQLCASTNSPSKEGVPVCLGKTSEQKKVFSGKKKNHTLKNQFIVLPLGEDLVDITVGDPGPKSDINQFRERLTKFAPKRMATRDKPSPHYFSVVSKQ